MKAYYLSIVFWCLACNLTAAPSIGLVRATPMTAVIGTPTQVTVTASISDPTLIAASVDLLQLNPNGTTTILGKLHDDGLNGDSFAGDRVFTVVVTLNEASATQVRLETSAAFKGVLERMKSPALSVFFQGASAPQQALASLAGVLSAGNTSAALDYVVAYNYPTISMLTQQEATALASMLNSAVLIDSQNDLRIFQSQFVAPDGTTITIELSMVPGANGQWLVNGW